VVLLTIAGTRLTIAEMTRERVTVDLEPVEPVKPDAWLLRLLVHNTSATRGTFEAKVVEISGIGNPGPEPEWWVPWRHHEGAHRVTLQAHSKEMLDLATIEGARTDTPRLPTISFPSVPAEGAARQQNATSICGAKSVTDLAGREILIRVRVWHDETGRIVAQKDFSLTLDASGSEIMPVLAESAA
jgi:hypothetical protein